MLQNGALHHLKRKFVVILHKSIRIMSNPISCINIAGRDLQMQDRSAFEPNNKVSLKVHRELTPDCNIFVMPEIFNRASSAFVFWIPA